MDVTMCPCVTRELRLRHAMLVRPSSIDRNTIYQIQDLFNEQSSMGLRHDATSFKLRLVQLRTSCHDRRSSITYTFEETSKRSTSHCNEARKQKSTKSARGA